MSSGIVIKQNRDTRGAAMHKTGITLTISKGDIINYHYSKSTNINGMQSR